MKLLVGYDGSNSSEAALDDLVRAGLPETGEAVIMSVSELWFPLNSKAEIAGNETAAHAKQIIKHHHNKGKKSLVEAEIIAEHAKKRLQRILPGWKIKAEAAYGSAAQETLKRADKFKPDLIVVGSHGRSAVSQFFLGSISNKVLSEAQCSVRVARGRVEVDPTPMRVIIGFDGSPGANAAVEAVASRRWREYTEIRLLAITDPVKPSVVGQIIPPIARMVEDINQSEHEWLEKLTKSALINLRKAGFNTSFNIHAGNPKQILVEEAEKWNADCIFLGVNRFGSRFERFLVGSVSAAVAARAACSVEVIRKTGCII